MIKLNNQSDVTAILVACDMYAHAVGTASPVDAAEIAIDDALCVAMGDPDGFECDTIGIDDRCPHIITLGVLTDSGSYDVVVNLAQRDVKYTKMDV